jgi:hypothetical protein
MHQRPIWLWAAAAVLVLMIGVRIVSTAAPRDSLTSSAVASTVPRPNEEYVEGMPTKAVMRRHSVSESTLHRYGRDATLALARELAERERVLAEPSGIGRTPKR